MGYPILSYNMISFCHFVSLIILLFGLEISQDWTRIYLIFSPARFSFFLLSLFNIDLFFIKIKGKKGRGRAGIGSLLEKEGIEEIKWQYV